MRTYPRALHGFDTFEITTVRKTPAGTVGYDPEAARSAWEEIKAFLAR